MHLKRHANPSGEAALAADLITAAPFLRYLVALAAKYSKRCGFWPVRANLHYFGVPGWELKGWVELGKKNSVQALQDGAMHILLDIQSQVLPTYRNPYIKGPKRQFFLHFLTIFLAAREAALAADLITA